MSLGEAARRDGGERIFRLPDPIQKLLNPLLGGNDGSGRTQRAALFAFLIRVVSAGIAYMSQVLLARWMGSFEYGIFVFVWVWVLILGGLASLGFSTSVVRFIPEYGESGKLELLRGLLVGAPFITLGVSTAMTMVALAGLASFGHLMEGYYLLPAVLIAFCLPLYALVDIQDGIARGYGWIDAALLPPYILRPLLILATMLAAYVIGFEANAVTAAGAAVVACWVTGAVQAFYLQKRIRRELPAGPRQYKYRFWLRISLPILLVASFELLMQNTDILVLSRYLTPDKVAIYFAALKTMALVSFVNFAVGTATAKQFSAFKARNDEEGLRQTVRKAVHWVFWPTLGGAAVILALGQPLLWLFGEEFISGYPVMFILALGFLVHASVGPVEFVLNMLGEQNRCAIVLFGAAALNVTLNFILIPQFGLQGAAIATAVSSAMAALLMAVIAKRYLGLDLFIAWPQQSRRK